MGNLSNLYISQSFQSLIHLGTNNTASATLIGLEDGYGNPIGVSVNTAGDLSLSGSFTASLQNGYVWVGNSSGKTTTVPTSSFGGGGSVPAGTISGSAQITALGFVSSSVTASSLITASASATANTITFTKGDNSTFNVTLNISSSVTASFATGSFAITGSNTFRGVQFISGSLTSYSGSNPGPNIFPTAIVVSGSIMPSMPNSFDLGNDDFKFNSLTVQGAVKAASLNINARCNLGTVIFGDETFPLSFLSPRELVADGTGVDTHLYYGTSSANPQGLREIAYIQSGSNANLAAYATTGSNYFVGSQTISGSTTLSGSLYIQSGSSTFPNGTGSALLAWDAATGRVTNTTYQSALPALFDVGAFYSTVTQSGSANVSGSFTFDNTIPINSISLTSGSRINIPKGGYYNLQFSIQIVNGASSADVAVWLKKNGNNVANTATYITVPSNHKSFLALNLWDSGSAGDYYEIAYQSDQPNTTYQYIAPAGNIPGSPSIILTVNQVR